MCANRSEPRAQASSKRHRAKPRKVAAQTNSSKKEEKQQQKKKSVHDSLVIDLTAEEDKKENQVEVDGMDAPAHLESDDYFEVLGLPRTASESDVKRAYRKLVVQWHPDKNRTNPRAEEFFKKISEAYEVLSDSDKRARYERHGKRGLDGGHSAAHSRAPDEDHFTGFGAGFSTKHARDIFDQFFGGQDPFEAFFGGGQRRGSTQRRGRFGDDPFGDMGFGGMGMGMGMGMRGFGSMGGVSMMDSFFSDGFGGMTGADSEFFSMSSSSSSSTFTDRNGHVVTRKTTTTTGADGRTETVTEEYRNGKLVNSTSSTGSRLADAGRMQLEGGNTNTAGHGRSYQRRASSNSRPKY
ncbi:Molecular chaperone (DnaJ superfamily) [Phytophthora cinnamomi]|uniref:Molecular chaperone (DnaJ superfamily) n=1 Tax=Phytophthora cinnamomi TaxID=4785 RepID=UPI00355A6D82|nr:Molecular chaperone (DnaJ superfamily) [Phytophthora cinnamomi]